MTDPIDDLIRAESPETASAIAILDAPGLVDDALARTPDVRVWCDDWRDAQLVDPDLLVEHPEDLAGVDLAWARLPKSLAALDEMAASVQGADDVTFLGAERDRHLNRSMNEVLTRHFTAVAGTLGRRKCRGLRAWGPNQLESEWPKLRRHEDLDLVLAAHGATFAGTKVDAGTRLLLENLELTGEQVLDFGSGNGVISAALARQGAQVAARDVSWSAVAATLETASANDLEIDATWGDGLLGYEDASFDAIVTNPPFHRGVAKDSETTLALFDEAARVLRPGGEFWCVFNSHLPWRKELNVRLGRTSVLAQDRHYTLTRTLLG